MLYESLITTHLRTQDCNYFCDKYPYLDTLYNCLSEAPGIDLENSVDESL